MTKQEEFDMLSKKLSDNHKKLMHRENYTNYLILFNDTERPMERFDDFETAYKRIEMLRDNWDCHLFKRIKSV